MIFGNPSALAIESDITVAYERLSFRALGYFVIYVCGLRYGCRSADSTLLACSFDEVGRRMARRGEHTVPFAAEASAGTIASAFREAIYGDEPRESYLGIPLSKFKEMIYSSHVVWAPDGDGAFDDGSYVLQFDIRDDVRVIAFKSTPDGGYDPASLKDIRLGAVEFYSILQRWHDAFAREWALLPKEE